ncbi:MAG: Uma2 family endonuclease [Chloroflexi bacterium]|nr:Uma2 family endonuclease [Chloroflexota bacterium]
MINAPEQSVPTVSAEELAARGFRYVEHRLPDSTLKFEAIPLTEQEYLHPEEGYHMPNSTFHEEIAGDARDMLTRRYAADAATLVLRDVNIYWEDPELEHNCPDVVVIFGAQNKDEFRESFHVAEEGARPSLIVEVVSPYYRKADRVTKVGMYERAGVQEYLIIDRRRYKGQLTFQALGYQLLGGRYREIVPDEQNRILCETVGVWFSMSEGHLVMEDAVSGERLLNSRELEARLREEQQARETAELRAREEQQARETAELRAREEQQARESAEQQVAALQARLAELETGRGA